MEKVNKEDIVSMIAHWSTVFNLPIKEEKEFPHRIRMELAVKLIDEEFLELCDAIDNKDLTEVQDALGDLLWVTVRAMMEFGINPLETIKAIYDSNMSKADFSLDNAELTRNKYLKQGIETYMKETDGIWLTYRTADDKVLKGIGFEHPNFK
jgi:NTP pyrophosphatase (non-canonical NTP hydrolase)